MHAKINPYLETVRGFMALIVIFGHIYYLEFAEFNNIQKSEPFAPPGHLAVLIFFILSGYVIGISNTSPLRGKAILTYIKKRFLRIYPIYVVSITFALLISTTHYTWPSILANYTLTHNIIYEPFAENNPAWSLNYELLYYLLYIIISFYNVKPLICIAGSFIIALIGLYLCPGTILSGYAIGFCFWTTGLLIAKMRPEESKPVKILAVLFFILSLEQLLKPFDILIKRAFQLIHMPENVGAIWPHTIVNIYDIKYLPICFLIILTLIYKEQSFKKVIGILAFFLSLSIIAMFYIAARSGVIDKAYLIGVVFYLLALACYFFNFKSNKLTNWGVWLGSVSYGVYIVHFPILVLFKKFVNLPIGLPGYVIKVALYLMVVFTIAWVLEKLYQPIIKKILN